MHFFSFIINVCTIFLKVRFILSIWQKILFWKSFLNIVKHFFSVKISQIWHCMCQILYIYRSNCFWIGGDHRISLTLDCYRKVPGGCTGNICSNTGIVPIICQLRSCNVDLTAIWWHVWEHWRSRFPPGYLPI